MLKENQISIPFYHNNEELYNKCIEEFNRVNDEFFEGKLKPPNIEFSTRLKTTAGKCYPTRKLIRLNINHYQQDGLTEFLRTLRHEIIHLIIPNHGKEFKILAKLLDVDRYWTTGPKRDRLKWKYWIYCPRCERKNITKIKRKNKILYCKYCFEKGYRVAPKYRTITNEERKKYNLL